jgi:hypothetical protein
VNKKITDEQKAVFAPDLARIQTLQSEIDITWERIGRYATLIVPEGYRLDMVTWEFVKKEPGD